MLTTSQFFNLTFLIPLLYLSGLNMMEGIYSSIYMPQAGIKPGLGVNVYLNLTYALTHSATTAELQAILRVLIFWIYTR